MNWERRVKVTNVIIRMRSSLDLKELRLEHLDWMLMKKWAGRCSQMSNPKTRKKKTILMPV